ncbi:hypothetical protein C2U70_15445 [Bradyrhizobium guangdongense]|uniref:hypothetical protein n=1 Tax=Bradyrhizobium guangdongense TaxID=1325090 RepID=UPI00112BAAD9|nr:hypothetical protein [Bradyrhizobium guangdongense]TPQ35133.1 hypothetical protein C2U70_15445 [Bradyrhizobium guangdongense]
MSHGRALRILVTLVALCSGTLSLSAAEDTTLERGTAITDPDLLRKLEQNDVLTISRLLWRERNANFPLTTDMLFGWLRQLAQIRPAIDAEFERYIARYKQSAPNETIGVGEGFDVQLFDRAMLNSKQTRFVLAGIVNRMDRAYVSEESCGEIRLIYRLTRFEAPWDGKAATRLPMTLNLVLKARDPRQEGRKFKEVTCAEIARRWLSNGDWLELVDGLPFPEDALIDRIETNTQVAVIPKSASHDFRTDYLLKVFKYNTDTRAFEESTLENQIDRTRLLADEGLRRDFKAWLLDPEHLRDFDRGTVLIPEKFLAKGAVVSTPGGLDPSGLQPEFGLMQGEGEKDPAFPENDVVGALKKAAERGIGLQNIRSVAGFQRRLNDITCAGCHQTRGIGGFHFPGVDWTVEKPSNSTIVPASPHFFGDQIRRRDILVAFRDGKKPDFSRGFASRPQLRGSTELAGTEYQDGWGAHCSLPGAGSSAADKSFTSWTCAKGLTCQAAGSSSRIGMCFVKTR